jgi:hypothetical protein
MEPEGSLPHSQVPATCPYPEPARSSPYPHIPLPEDPSSCQFPGCCCNCTCPLYRLLTFHVPNIISRFRCTKISVGVRNLLFRNMIRLYGEELLAPRPTPKLEDRPLSAVRDCLFNIFAATLHIGGRSSIRNTRTRHAVPTGTEFSRMKLQSRYKNSSLQI